MTNKMKKPKEIFTQINYGIKIFHNSNPAIDTSLVKINWLIIGVIFVIFTALIIISPLFLKIFILIFLLIFLTKI